MQIPYSFYSSHKLFTVLYDLYTVIIVNPVALCLFCLHHKL